MMKILTISYEESLMKLAKPEIQFRRQVVDWLYSKSEL